jgi:ABC-type phosphate transport system ATPase subunit
MMVFRQPHPFPMSVFDNVAHVRRKQAKRRPEREAVRGAVQAALARAGLLDVRPAASCASLRPGSRGFVRTVRADAHRPADAENI